MIGSRYRVLGVCLFVIVVAPLQTEAQTITAACDVSTPPIWASVPALQKRLTDDGFRDVLEIYRTDLDRLSAAHEPWLERAQDWLNNICLPSLAAANAYQSNCRSALAAATPSCQSAHANAVRMEQEEQAAATTLNADYQDLENRLRGAIDRANEVLKPEVTEQMFTRLVARIHGKNRTVRRWHSYWARLADGSMVMSGKCGLWPAAASQTLRRRARPSSTRAAFVRRSWTPTQPATIRCVTLSRISWWGWWLRTPLPATLA